MLRSCCVASCVRAQRILAPSSFIESLPERFGFEAAPRDDERDENAAASESGTEDSGEDAAEDSEESSSTSAESTTEDSASGEQGGLSESAQERLASDLVVLALAHAQAASQNTNSLHQRHRFRKRWGMPKVVANVVSAVKNFFGGGGGGGAAAQLGGNLQANLNKVQNTVAQVQNKAQNAIAQVQTKVAQVQAQGQNVLNQVNKVTGGNLNMPNIAKLAGTSGVLAALGGLAASLPAATQKLLSSKTISDFLNRPIPAAMKIPIATSTRVFEDRANVPRTNDPPGSEDIKPDRCAAMETCCLFCYSTWPGDTIDPTTKAIRKKLREMQEESEKRAAAKKAGADRKSAYLQQPQLLFKGQQPGPDTSGGVSKPQKAPGAR